MGNVYGIDLGTTYSAIATLENNMPQVIVNFADSKPLLASAVYFPEDGDPVIGEAAKNQLEVESDRVVQFVKREIGKADAQKREFNGVTYDPITISSLILKRMAEYAKEQGHDVKDVVITCPAYFGNEERNATRQAGIIAGFNVLNIVNEPTAAAFNYLSREFKESKKIMVYDLGGGTFDITLFDFSVEDGGKTTIDVICSGGNDRLGGADWDARLFNYIADLFVEEIGSISRDDLNNDGELKQKIRTLVESTKISLSSMATKNFTINHNGESVRLAVTREKFEEITNDLVEQTVDYVNDLLKKSKTSSGDVDIVLLVGGSTRMPMIKTAVEKIFPAKVRFEDPDLAVAKGAALAAAVEYNERIRDYIEQVESGAAPAPNSEIEKIFGDGEAPKTAKEAERLMISVPKTFEESTKIIDRLSRSFGPAVLDSKREYLMIDNLLFVRDESPSEITKEYYTPPGYPDSLKIEIYENLLEKNDERNSTGQIKIEDSKGNEISNDPALLIKNIGQVVVELPPKTPENAPIQFTIKARTGGLDVIAKNPATGQIFEAFIASEHTLTPEQLNEEIKRFSTITTRGDY